MPMTMYLAPASDEIENYMAMCWCAPVAERVEARTNIAFDRTITVDRQTVDEFDFSDHRGVYYFGHGTEQALGDPALIDVDNVGRISGTLVAVACDAAEVLGPAAIAGGTQTFVGFSGRIPIIVDSEYDAVVVDNLADLASDRCSPHEFRRAFRAACLELSERAREFPRKYVNAPLILVGADAMRGSVQVLVTD